MSKYGKGPATLRSSRMRAVETSPAGAFVAVDYDAVAGTPPGVAGGHYAEPARTAANPAAPPKQPTPFTLK